MEAISHLAGVDITAEGRFVRQRCSWCGEILVDVDLSLAAVPEGQKGNPAATWKVGDWIEVEGVWPTVYRVADAEDGKFPANSCMARELPKPKPRLVPVEDSA